MLSLSLLILAFVSGVLTVLAPCVLPLLPVIIGSSINGKDKSKPFLVTGGLVISITLFTLLLKASTSLIFIDPIVWKIISGGIILMFGLVYLFPSVWDSISTILRLSQKSDNLLHSASKKEGWFSSLLIGASMGPVFASCSPTYALIVATVLPVKFVSGVVYIIVYALGLAIVMLLTSILGRTLINKLKFAANPNGTFKKVLGVLFVLLGLSIILGYDKAFEAYLISNPFFDVTKVEQFLLDKFMR